MSAETHEKTVTADEIETVAAAAAAPEAAPATDEATEETEETAEGADDTTAKDAGFAEQVKRIALAAAEAVSISPDDVKGFVSKLVEKGELAQTDGKRIVQDLGDRLKQVVKEPGATAQKAREKAENALRSLAGRLGRREKGGEGEKAEKAEGATDAETPVAAEGVQALAERINASIERVLGAMHIASASEIRSLREKIEALDAKIEKALER